MEPSNNLENKTPSDTYWRAKLVYKKVLAHSSLEPPLEYNQQGLTNCMHGDDCIQHACKKFTMCTKLCAHKSIKTPLGSNSTIFKIKSYFYVWKQLKFGTKQSDINSLFQLRSCC